MAPVGDRIANEAVPESERRGRQPGGRGSAAPEGRVTVKLEPSPEKEDPEGKSSKFVGKSDKLPKEGKLSGTVSGKVGTKPYTGDFKEE